jgi:hypothetical protein
MNSGLRAVRDFVAERVTAIRGYFDEVFTNTSHQKTLCIGDRDTEGETCITKSQLDMLLHQQSISATTVTTQTPVVPDTVSGSVSDISVASSNAVVSTPTTDQAPVVDTAVTIAPTDTQ